MTARRSTKKEPVRLSVTNVKWELAPPVPAARGFMIFPKFTIHATLIHPRYGDLEVEVEVEMEGERASARRVSIGTDRPGGLIAPMLRAVAVREIVAHGIRMVLLRVEGTADGGAQFVPAAEMTERGTNVVSAEAVEVIKTLVRYVDPKEES
jgi:hypothetical protein